MEKRALIAIVLSVALLLAWQAFFAAPPPPPSPEGQGPAPAPGAAPTPAAESARGAPKEGGDALPRPPAPVRKGGRSAEISAPLYQGTFGSDGSVTGWTLLYRGAKTIVVPESFGPLTVAVSRPGQPPEVIALEPAEERLELGAQTPRGTLSFTGVAKDGLRIERRLHFDASSYRIEAELRAEGGSGEPATLVLYWTTPVALPGRTRDAPWVTVGEARDHQEVLGRILVGTLGEPEAFEAPPPALKDSKDPTAGPELKDPHLVPTAVLPGNHPWVALENDYFISALVPRGGARVLRGRDRDLAQVGVVFQGVRPEPGRAWEGKAELYVGPREWVRLAEVGLGV